MPTRANPSIHIRIRAKAWTHARNLTDTGLAHNHPLCDMRGSRYEQTREPVTCPYCLEILRAKAVPA